MSERNVDGWMEDVDGMVTASQSVRSTGRQVTHSHRGNRQSTTCSTSHFTVALSSCLRAVSFFRPLPRRLNLFNLNHLRPPTRRPHLGRRTSLLLAFNPASFTLLDRRTRFIGSAHLLQFPLSSYFKPSSDTPRQRREEKKKQEIQRST